MSVQKLEQVMMYLRQRNKGSLIVTNYELRRAILLLIGTDKRTYEMNRKALKDLDWIRTFNSQKVELTDNDL